MKKRVLGFSVALFTIAGISAASAHTVLIASNPTQGAVIKALPTKITLSFADPLLTLGRKIINKVVVIDSTNKVVTTGNDVTKGAVLSDSLAKIATIAAKSGKYRVSYRVSAQDGHIVSGSFFFTVRN